MIRDLKPQLHRSPPTLPKLGAAKSNASAGEPKALANEDRADIKLEDLDVRKAAAPNADKIGFTAVLGALAMLGLTGLGMFQGAGQAAPVQQVEQTITSETLTPSQTQAPEVLAQMEVSPQMLVAGRQGSLLGPGKILKFDQFPGMARENLKEIIPGAPNFRQVEGSNVYGVAQPTIDGIRAVLDRTQAKDKPLVWTNMREEPMLYINGRSFSLREEAHPFENSSDFTGVDGQTVERTEDRLKAEVLAEAKANGGKFLVHTESKDGVVSEWVEITPESVKTTREVYQDFQNEGYKIDFARVPVTDEKTPEAGDLQALVARVTQAKEGSSFIFNCHAGRGRTTTSMVVAQLVQRAMNPEAAAKPFQKNEAVREDIKEQGQYQLGNYRTILTLIKALNNGMETKLDTDAVLDRTEDLQNLRTDINTYREKTLSATNPGSAKRAEDRGIDYLHRYHTLITFNQYAKEQAPEGFKVSYEDWLASKPELTQLLEQLELAMLSPGASNTGYA